MNPKAIKEFWDWFLHHSKPDHKDTWNPVMVAELDKRLKGINPGFSWELGEGRDGSHELTISPNLDPDLRSEAVNFVNSAPATLGWRFYSARQRKDWNFTFEFELDSGEAINVDASGWRFVLLRYPEGDHEVLLEVGSLANRLNATEMWQAAAIALESILGEDLVMDMGGFDAVEKFSEADRDASRPIQELSSAFGLA